ncbi:MAG: hypothetical protein LBK25_07980 [Treponema sp.]|nr:hypothetical protein [Treponema sp.]
MPVEKPSPTSSVRHIPLGFSVRHPRWEAISQASVSDTPVEKPPPRLQCQTYPARLRYQTYPVKQASVGFRCQTPPVRLRCKPSPRLRCQTYPTRL